MSLFGAIHLANNALRAQQIGLQVTGQNIANANTPGYIREEVTLKPAPTQRVGNLLLGLGVQVEGVVQKIDKFLEQRLRRAISDHRSSEAQRQTYQQLEGIVGELTDTDLSTALSKFSATIQDVLAQPESPSARNLAVLQGQTLAQEIVRIAQRTGSIRRDVNQRVINLTEDANRLIEEVRTLNIRIANFEGGDISGSDAVGLRDQRNQALADLATLVDIDVKEQPSGGVNVFVGGEYLVLEGTVRKLQVSRDTDRGLSVATVEIESIEAPLRFSSGEIQGLVESRDTILGGFLDRLDELAGKLAYQFNKIYSSGQGLSGYQELTGAFAVDDPTAALDEAGLSFVPTNGSFQIQVLNKQTGTTKTYDFFVRLGDLPSYTTLADLVDQINATGVLTATVSAAGQLAIRSLSKDQDFSFANDTSGALAALGLNVFFTGSSATDLGVSSILLQDPGKLATSGEGIGSGSGNALALVEFLDAQVDPDGGQSLTELYERIVGEVTQASTVAGSIADGLLVFEESLRGQQLGVSGVSLDEEAVKMITYQRAYQASARFIQTISELLEILVNL